MTTRDRWIIYPLLFLAIGLGMRSGILLQDLLHRLPGEGTGRTIEADVVRCKSLDAGSANLGRLQCPQIQANAAFINVLQYNAAQILGPNNQPRITMETSEDGSTGVLRIHSSDGKAVVVLAADPSTKAGLIETGTPDGVQQTMLRSMPTGGSLTLFSPDAKRVVFLGPAEEKVQIFNAAVTKNQATTNLDEKSSPSSQNNSPKSTTKEDNDETDESPTQGKK